MFIDLVKAAAVLLALCLLQGINSRLWPARSLALGMSAGVLFGGICVIGMMMPIVLADGLIFDGRSAILGMAGLFGGALVAAIAAGIAAAYRLWLGGAGATIGVTVIFACALLGLAYRHAVARGWLRRGALQFLGFGLILHLGALALFLLLPVSDPAALVSRLAFPYLAVLAPATAILGLLLQDLENRRGVEAALVASESRMRAITSALPDVLLVLDENGRHLEVISQDPELLVAAQHSLIGRLLHDVLPSTVAERLLAVVRRTIAEHQPQRIVYELETLGGWRTFEGRSQPLESVADDRPAVLLLARDISARVAADQERRVAAIAFESQQGMAITDANGVLLKVNQGFTRISGYEPRELIGRTPEILDSGRHRPAFYEVIRASLAASGAWQGEIWSRRKNGEIFPQWLTVNAVRDAEGTVTHYVAGLTDITQRKLAEEEIRNLAFYDPLTHLPNRRLLMDRLRQALNLSGRNASHGALMFIDLDDFKDVNDLLGHHVGDLLLQQAASRLCASVRMTDTVARLGGDEFVIMLEQLDSRPEAAREQTVKVAEKALDALMKPYTLDGQVRLCSASIGIVNFLGSALPVEALMKQADLSMYEAKRGGKNRLRFYDPRMEETITSRLRLEDDIRRSAAAGDFLVHYQPQFNDDAGLIGAEALLRWQHPERGMVLPGQFIDAAEHAGLMPQLGMVVLETACLQLASWAQRPQAAHLTIAVNVSAQQLFQTGFVEQVRALIARTGAPPNRLILEITESLLLDDIDEAITRMNQLRARGVCFSIDDFGTGYSSLAYLQRLPLDQLKIDRSFVHDLAAKQSSLAIVKAIIALADTLDLKVIAEGVESEAQRATLRANGCGNFQGYLFARPMSEGELEARFLPPDPL